MSTVNTIDATRYINGDGIPPNIYSHSSSLQLNLYWINTKNIRIEARRGTFSIADIDTFISLIKHTETNILGDNKGFKADLNQIYEARIGAQKFYDENKKSPDKLPQNHINLDLLLNDKRYFYGPRLTN
eukprot:147867_1